MKFMGILAAGFFYSANALADNAAMEQVVADKVGQFFIQQTAATLKADFAAISLHCLRLDKQFAPRFAERRIRLEQEWLENISKTAWAMKMIANLMVSRMPANSSSSGPTVAPAIEPERKLDRLPAVPADVQESANRKSMDQVAKIMETLTPEQQRERCEAEFVPGSLPAQPDTKGMVGM